MLNTNTTEEKLHPCILVSLYCLVLVEPFVPVGILFCAPFELPFPKAVIPNSHFSVSSFSLSRRPFSCSTEEIKVTSKNPLNFLSLYLFLHLSLPPFFLSQRCVPFFSNSIVQIFIGHLLCPRYNF